jgi:selenocysteine lyase/cysteine desulfurase
MASQMDRDWSDRFPILNQIAFFDHAGVAPVSAPAAAALRAYADQAEARGYVDAGWYKRIESVRALGARIIGAASADEIAFVANTTTGLNMVAGGMAWREGDEVVITNVEFPANRYPWKDLERFGVRVVEVEAQSDGRIDVEDVCEAITDHTRVVSISSVQYASGYRIDLKPIADMVHRAGGYLCVDAIQSVGAVPMDVHAAGIDFLAADGHKWMLAPEGCGLFYCRHDLIELLHPALVGWMCVEDHTNYGDYRLEFARGGRRFEPGSYNVGGVLALAASMELLLETGLDAIWSRIETLTERLCRGLVQKGYDVVSPRSRESERSGIVIFRPHPGAPPPERIVADARAAGVVIVVREGRLRASPHFYNREEQVDRLLDVLP